MTAKFTPRQAAKIQTLAERDQLAAALRDADTAVTAAELGERVGFAVFVRHRLRTEDGTPCQWSNWWSHYNDALDIHMTTMRHIAARHMPALERAGLAGRTKVGGSVYWAWKGEPVDMTGIKDPAPAERGKA